MIKKIGDGIEKITMSIIAIFMGVMIIVAVAAVILRYIFHSAPNWTEELCAYLMIWSTFLGVAVAYRHFELTLLDMFVNKLPLKIQAIVRLIVHIIVTVTIAWLAVTGIQYGTSPSLLYRKSTTLPVSMFVPFSSVPIGFILMFLFSLENIPGMIKEIKESPMESPKKAAKRKEAS